MVNPFSKESQPGTSLTDATRVRILESVRAHREKGNGDFRLPGEPQLGKQLKVSRVTLRRAMDQLVASGDLVRCHGRGTFVVKRKKLPVALRRGIVGLLYRPEQMSDYAVKIITALERAAQKHGFLSTIYDRIADVDSWRKGRGIPTSRGPILGYISNTFELSQVALLESRGVPVICLNGLEYLGHARYVIYESPQNMTMAFEKLLGLGHQHLAYIGPNAQTPRLCQELEPSRIRLDREYPGASLSLIPCGTEPGDMDLVARQLVEEESAPTGLVVYDDLYAAWLMNALRDAERRVPDDFSIIACLNSRAALATRPQIASLDLQYDAIAEEALALFVKILEGTAPPRKRVATLRKLIERGSVGPVPGRRTAPAEEPMSSCA